MPATTVVGVVGDPCNCEGKPMEDYNKAILEQSAVEHHNRIKTIQEASLSGMQFLNEQARAGFLHESRLVGAAAAMRIHLPAEILAQRSAGGQPQASAGNAGVNSGGT